jgi:ParB family chromosome partitioning protein
VTTKKLQDLLKSGGANMANSLGIGASGPALSVVRSEGVDKYAGRTRGNGGEMLLSNVMADPDQPRREFDEAELSQLAESLKTHGQLQPITVRWTVTRSRSTKLSVSSRRR